MDITYRFVGDVTILALNGRLTVSPGEREVLRLRSAIGKLMREGRVRVALDLRKARHIDARGLGELVSVHAALRRRGGQLTLVAPSARVRQLLAVTRLDTVLAQCDSERDVIEATYQQPRASRTWASARVGTGA